MFTGIIKEVGTIKSIEENTEGYQLEIQCPKIITSIERDDSIAINGICLTATEVLKDSFLCQAVHTTLEKTNLKNVKLNSLVNIEPALTLQTKISGHLVQGHVNTTTKIQEIETIGDNWNFSFLIAPQFSKYIVKEGSICIDGTSLTISDHSKLKDRFSVTIIPHTLENTIFRTYKSNSTVNIEFDMIFKYLESIANFQGLL